MQNGKITDNNLDVSASINGGKIGKGSFVTIEFKN